MAAPGRPKVCVCPSFSKIWTMASTARIRAMGMASLGVLAAREPRGSGWGGGIDRREPSAARLRAGEPLGGAEEAGVVQVAVTVAAGGDHQLGERCSDRDGPARLAGGSGDDADVLVVQVDAEARGEV